MQKAVLIFFILSTLLFTQNTPRGTLKGKIVDVDNLQPLIGVNIIIKDKNIGASSDENGNYVIENLQVGTYTVVFSYLGYESVAKTDVIIKSGRTIFLNAELKSSLIEMSDVVVEAGYFSEVESKPVSTVNFSAEEIRRAPGSAGDVSRILYGLPSLSKVNDSKNSLIVRGGSPVENSFYLDNIEIPNINHYQVQGSSDGPIGLINVDFIEDVNFYAGGFSPVYGDRLSSIMELSFREGNTDNFEAQLQMSLAGFGGSVEGPIGNKGSYMFSANRSYLDFIIDKSESGGGLPVYGDFQGKVVYNINDKNKLTFLNIFSKDDSDNSLEDAIEYEVDFFGYSDDLTNVAGINWQYVWGEAGYSNTSVSHMYNSFKRDYGETKSGLNAIRDNTLQNHFKLRNVNYFNASKKHSFEFGIEAAGMLNDFDVTFQNEKDNYGNVPDPVHIDKNLNTFKGAFFASHNWNLTEKLSLEYGGRADYFEFGSKTEFSPRANLSYKINPDTKINASAGIFYQFIPNYILVQNDAFKDLKTPKSIHYVLGFSKKLNESAKLTIEAYYKDYENFPIDPEQPDVFLFDQVMIDGLFLNHERLVDNGRAISKGVEVMIQKKLAEDFYGLVSASISKSRYRDFNGVWRNRIYDNEFNFNIEGGYIPNDNWEFKVRWIYAGGAPYIPFDVEESKKQAEGIWDTNRINSERLPAYHSLNIRVDKRFYFQGSNLIVYLSVWNAYGRNNIAGYEWNEILNKQKEIKQWSTLPVIGLEYEF
ncbi:MAG: TonB-dependent receptor [Ignavibacteria bacterium]|jgi:outer membrane receptor for ferrienterochelin and colicin